MRTKLAALGQYPYCTSLWERNGPLRPNVSRMKLESRAFIERNGLVYPAGPHLMLGWHQRSSTTLIYFRWRALRLTVVRLLYEALVSLALQFYTCTYYLLYHTSKLR